MHMNIRRMNDRKHHKRSKRGSNKVTDDPYYFVEKSMRCEIVVIELGMCFLGGSQTESRIFSRIQAKRISKTAIAWYEIASIISKYYSKTFPQS